MPSRSAQPRAGSTAGSCSSTAASGIATCSAAAFSDSFKRHLREQLHELRPSRLLFLKKPERRSYGRRRVWFGTSKPGAERFFQLEVDHLEDLRGFDFAAALAGTGTPGVPSTTRCSSSAPTASATAAARRTAARSTTPSGRDGLGLGLAVHHVGGDRFAGNVVVFPQALYYGRVEPGDAGALLAAHAAGRIDPSATAAAPPTRSPCRRPSSDPRGGRPARHRRPHPRPLSPVGDDGWRVRFRSEAGVYEVDVEAELADEPVYLTCGAAEPSRPRHQGDGGPPGLENPRKPSRTSRRTNEAARVVEVARKIRGRKGSSPRSTRRPRRERAPGSGAPALEDEDDARPRPPRDPRHVPRRSSVSTSSRSSAGAA